MAITKKENVTVKNDVKKETVNATETKAIEKPVEKKAEPQAAVKSVAKVTEAVAETKTTAKKAPVKKATAKKETTAKATPKTAAKKVEVKATVCVQFEGKSYTNDDLIKIAKDVWKFDLKKKANDLVSLELYLKPEESTVYYVMNGDVNGSFQI